MSLITLSINDLVCYSLLDSGMIEPKAVHDLSAIFGGEPIKYGCAQDVLYIPELRLQVVAQKLVPLEVTAHIDILKFEQNRQFHGKASRYTVPFEVEYVDRDVCILSNFYSRNFYHWLTEEMFKVVVLERSGFKGAYVLPNLPSFVMQFMQLLQIEEHRLIGEVNKPTVYRHAAYISTIHGGNVFNFSHAFQEVRKALLTAALPSRILPHRRVWIERKTGVNNPGRDLVNTEEVYRLLEGYDVQIVDMAALSVQEQIEIAHSSSLLAGIHGAGFAHTMFMAPMSTVIECYSPLFINPGVFDICRILRHNYNMVVYEKAYADYTYGNKVMINCAQLDLALRYSLANDDK